MTLTHRVVRSPAARQPGSQKFRLIFSQAQRVVANLSEIRRVGTAFVPTLFHNFKRWAQKRCPPYVLACLATFWLSATSHAGTQAEEHLAPSVVAALSKAVSDQAAPRLVFDHPEQGRRWLADMKARLPKGKPQVESAEQFLTTVQYEATRAGLDPQLVLAVIQHESAFRKYAVSVASARGYMQVMPFWVKLIGAGQDHNLFHLRTNIRYGCVILRHYLDREDGNVQRALARYNGSLGRTEYSNTVLGMLHSRWQYDGGTRVHTQ